MSHRLARLAHIVRHVVSDAIANRVSDPRISPFTSITRIELSTDLKFADVFVSVMASEADCQTTMKGLQSARGMIQTRLAKRLETRQCPHLRFHLDMGIKIGIETVRAMDRGSPASPEGTTDPTQMPSEDRSEEPGHTADRHTSFGAEP
ncbi:MAG: 30S ribosome-binding factor RbfA [Planctomycetota bacterium]